MQHGWYFEMMRRRLLRTYPIFSRRALCRCRTYTRTFSSSNSSNSSLDDIPEEPTNSGLRRSERLAPPRLRSSSGEEKEKTGWKCQKRLGDLPNEMLFHIYSHLDKKSVLAMRKVSRRFKGIADDWLKQTNIIPFLPFMTPMDQIEHFSRRDLKLVKQVHTIFTSPEKMMEFTDEMPFENDSILTRSILLGFSDINISCDSCLQQFETTFHRFLERFGEHVNSCFVVFSKKDYKSFNVALLKGLFHMKNLRNLSMFCEDWGIFRYIDSTTLPRLEHLKQLQIYGRDGISLLYYTFFRSQSTRNLVNLRVCPNLTFRGSAYRFMWEWENVNATEGDGVVGIPKFPSIHELLPRVKKLVLHDPCASLIKRLGHSEGFHASCSLEEFSVFFEQVHCCDPAQLTLVGSVLKALDERHAKSLKSLNFYIKPRHLGKLSRVRISNHVTELVGEVTYPNVKKITITFATVQVWPQFLVILGNKCPNLEVLEFRGLTRHFENEEGQASWFARVRFHNYCRKTWGKMPNSLRSIIIPKLNLCSIKLIEQQS